jgi:hypothetical protein
MTIEPFSIGGWKVRNKPLHQSVPGQRRGTDRCKKRPPSNKELIGIPYLHYTSAPKRLFQLPHGIATQETV